MKKVVDDIFGIVLAAMFLGAGLLMFTLTACKAIEQQPATAQLVTQYAVAKYLETKKDDRARYDAAQRILVVVTELRAAAQGETSLGALRQRLGLELSTKALSPADRVLVDGLANMLFTELEVRFKSATAPLDPEQLVQVNQVLGWVQSVALLIPSPAT